jgi:hypothetical protein
MADIETEPKVATQPLSAKDRVRAMLDNIPDDVTLEDIQYHLHVVVKITRSEERAEREGWIPHEEVERRLAKWLE